MALNKAQLMVPPGGPGVTGAVKQAPGSAVTITDGVAEKLATGVGKLLAGSNITLDPSSGTGTVTVNLTPPAINADDGDFDTGDLVPFLMATAPAGWTKSVAFNNGTLRVSSGTGGAKGGSAEFTTSMVTYQVSGNVSANFRMQGDTNDTSLTPTGTLAVNLATDPTTLNQSQMGSHQHNYSGIFNEKGNYGAPRKTGGSIIFGLTANDSGSGGGNSHLHDLQGNCSLVGQASTHKHAIDDTASSQAGIVNGNSKDFNVRYVDLILCTKN